MRIIIAICYLQDVHNVTLKPMPSTLSQLTCDEVSDSTLSELRRQSNNDDEDDGNLHLSSIDETSCVSSSNNIGSLDGESVDMPIGRMEGIKERVEKENELSEDGFISIRKKRCYQVKDGNVIRCLRVVNGQDKDSDDNIVRKVLSEISNFSSGSSKGKWQCPQRNKPELGPPLKQLRLDQWFYRQ